MPRAIEDTLDNVPEALREFYTEKNGKYELTGIEGIKTQADVERVQEGLRKERSDHAALKAKFAPLKDFDVNDVIAKLDSIPVLEAAANGGKDEVAIQKLVEAKAAVLTNPLHRQINDLKAQLGEKESALSSFQTREKVRTINDAVSRAAAKLKIIPDALEDVLLYGERHFDIDESNQVITRDGVGVTPGLDPEVWLQDMVAKRPHWLGSTEGAGASGSSRGTPGVKNPFTAGNWNETEQMQLIAKDRAKAEQMARAAGTTIGGKKPAK